MILRRILITAISGDIANGILKILSEDDSNELYGCDVNEIAIGMHYVKYFWKCRYAIEDGYVDELLGKCIDYKISHLIVANEREIEAVAKEIEQFEKLGIKTIIQSRMILENCLDKYKTMKFLSSNGITVPKTYTSLEETRWDEKKRYILKQKKSNGSNGIQIIDRKEDIKNQDISDYILQEYIDGEEEYTIGIFRQKDITNMIIFRRILRAGFSYRVTLCKDLEIEELVRKVADLFSLEGFINVQLMKKNNKLYIFEINPRISGTVRFRHMLGFKDVLWWLNMLDGKTIEQYKCPYDTAIGVRELNEKFLVLKPKLNVED